MKAEKEKRGRGSVSQADIQRDLRDKAETPDVGGNMYNVSTARFEPPIA